MLLSECSLHCCYLLKTPSKYAEYQSLMNTNTDKIIFHFKSYKEYAHALTTASIWHQFPAPSLSRHRPTPQLALLCSSRPFIPPSFHPSIRPCPVIYNSSGILPPSTPLHQDSINILFGPQLHCTHMYVVCLRQILMPC